jgi:uncharacterized protein
MNTIELQQWEARFAGWVAEQMAEADAAHDMEHIRRVVHSARQLALAEQAELAVVVPAAWLHDCISVPKNSPLRNQASRLAADAALAYLSAAGYPEQHLAPIAHAIQAHSFSAKIAPRTIEAMVVQDADRLDAIGAIGIARCLALGGALGRQLYDPLEPFPLQRTPDDNRASLDHFYTKLFKLGDLMQTAAGRAEAAKRTAFMQAFLAQLGEEIGR